MRKIFRDRLRSAGGSFRELIGRIQIHLRVTTSLLMQPGVSAALVSCSILQSDPNRRKACFEGGGEFFVAATFDEMIDEGQPRVPVTDLV